MARQKAQNAPVRILPEGSRDFFVRLALRLAGISLTVTGLIVAIALFSFDANDPSLNHATSAVPHNLFGTAGSIGADLLLQWLGVASGLLALAFAVFGARLTALALDDLKLRRVACIVPGIFLTMIALALGPQPSDWPLSVGIGGMIGVFSGTFVLSGISSLAQLAQVSVGVLDIAAMILPLIFWALAIPVLSYALGLHWRTWKKVISASARGSAISTIATGRAIAMVTRWVGGGARAAHGAAQGAIERRRIASDEADGAYDEIPEQEDETSPKKQSLFARTATFFKETEERLEERLEPRFDTESNDVNDDRWVETEKPSNPKKSLNDPKPVMDDAGRVARTKPKTKASKRAQTEAQRTLDLGDGSEYVLPPLSLLETPPADSETQKISDEALEQNARLLEGVLEDFGIRGEIIQVRPGPVVTLYELEPAPGIKSSRVIGLADDIARSMAAISARVAVVPGRNAIGIELPNSSREMVFLKSLLTTKNYESPKVALPLALGKDIGGDPVIADLAKMPHLLIAGTTGSGKSVAVNTMILSLLYRMTPEQCKFIMIDPKMLELSVYDDIPHLLSPVVTDPRKAVVALKWAVKEMESRYKAMAQLGVRNITGYNTRVDQARKKGENITRTVQTGFDEEGKPVFEEQEMNLDPLPFIVVIVDEMADLMMVAGKDVEGSIQRLAQMARAAGLHLIMATQRPSVDVITGTIKANFPTRISFQVTSKIDSRTILGEQGAEQLLGQGDMLYMAGGGRIQRVHGPFASDEEVEEVVKELKLQGIPDYVDAVTTETEDMALSLDGGNAGAGVGAGGNELYDQAVAIVTRERKASTSFIQRRLSIGYNRAANLMERLEEEGVVSAPNTAGKREILAPPPV